MSHTGKMNVSYTKHFSMSTTIFCFANYKHRRASEREKYWNYPMGRAVKEGCLMLGHKGAAQHSCAIDM